MKSLSFEENPSLRLPKKVQQHRISRVVQEQLTEKQREVLIAYYFQQMSIPEIARQRGVNKSTVCRLLQRAEKRLKQFLMY